MSMTIAFGWWVAPAVVTIVAYGWAAIVSRPDGRSYGLAAIGEGAVALFFYGLATVASLAAWLVWAVAS